MKKALLTTIPSDSHGWNLIYMELLLKEQGYDVNNLGVCVPNDLVIDECEKNEPDLVVVSTVNGHGYMEGKQLARSLAKQKQRLGFELCIGGKLNTDPTKLAKQVENLKSSGFDGVYAGPAAVVQFIEDISINNFSRRVAG
ncbi:MAG: cobalamin B12-binding domain-containing protein [Algicola sp.]|nr:cobalamin B12-binding domain-containing protein [Algicola sp.]